MRLISACRKELFLAATILTAAYIIQWYLIDYVFTGMPELIPETNINIGGVALLIAIVATLYIFQKKVLKKLPDTTLIQLTGLSVLICYFSEIVFQATRYLVKASTFLEDVYDLVHGTIISFLIAAAMAFLTALNVKHPKSIWNWIIPIAGLIIVYLLKKYTTLLPGNIWVPGQEK